MRQGRYVPVGTIMVHTKDLPAHLRRLRVRRLTKQVPVYLLIILFVILAIWA